MAASVYATPPPDHLSGDETALSDVSNSSQISSPSNSMKTLKRSLSASSLLSTTSATEVSGAIIAPSVTTSSSNNSPIASNATTIPFAGNINITLPSSIMSTLDTLAAASNDTIISMNSLSSLLDSMPDNSKKRRKQSTPIRISETIKAAGMTMTNPGALALIEAAKLAANGQSDGDRKIVQEIDLASRDKDNGGVSSSSPPSPPPQQLQLQLQLQLQQQQQQQQQHQASSLPRIYLQSLSQLQEKNALPLMNFKFDHKENGQNDNGNGKKLMNESHEQILRTFANNLNCDQCGLKLDTEIQLGLHILQEHAPKNLQPTKMVSDQKTAEDEIPRIFVKKEMGGSSTAAAAVSAASTGGNNWTTNSDDDKDKSAIPMLPNGMKPEDWLASLSNLPFAFPPEAAVMLQATGYLPQLPLLGVPSNPFATGQDGMIRTSAPPLRIFNPEAYCDLCNKEFCNKYFLKTHKANKHNIYEAPTSATDTPTTSQLNQISQVFQMQQQQLAAQQQLMSPKSPPQQTQQSQQQLPQQQQQQSSSQSQSPSGISQSNAQENLVMCDVCFKRYPNVLAMRRHRSKAHEIPPPTNDANSDGKMSSNIPASSSAAAAAAATTSAGTSTAITMPDGFREDFTIEQEDTTFTPQPRKLSPQSIQQAREANFSVEKLKRLGVINPEAFCEICCKEYCNKYFLRTHKIKRHGIYMPLDDSILKDGRSMANAAVAAASAWQLMQNAPLNLIMSNAEALSQLQNQRKKLEAGEIRKLSIESIDDEFEQPSKKCKLNDNDKKSMDETDDADDIENKSTENQQDSENISVDLQKLQSMIMQLNDLSAQRPVICGICGKEQENQFVLHTHMLTEHTTIGDNNNGALKSSPSTSPTVINQSTESLCKHCDKELPNTFALNQHMFEVHGISPASPAREGFVTPERPISGMSLPPQTPNASINERRTYTITPTSSYCEICNKELCNKYFMKTHMQRMHGIEIENGAQIGGVVCNICNKELCSKYFLRVHKHNTHGIVEDGSPLPQPRSQNGSEPTEPESIFPVDSTLKAGEIPNDLGNRYFSHFTEVCPLCNRRFRGSKWLRTHLLADHGKAGTDKLREIEQQLVNLPKSSASPPLKIPNGTFGALNPSDPNFMQKQALTSLFGVDDMSIPSPGSKTKEYQCNFCSFSTPSYAFLYIHKRSLHASLLTNEALAGLNVTAGDNNDLASQSESAVSIAKDHQPLTLKTKNEVTSMGNTPISTPATTPTPIQIPANECIGLNSNISPLLHKETPISDVEMLLKSTSTHEQQQQQQQTTSATVRIKDEQQRQDQIEAQNILAEMANITKRPTTYAIPQEFGQGMFMQSFLMEPIENVGTADDDSTTVAENKSRFVPSIVFLPVRERIVGKTTISFSLTPA